MESYTFSSFENGQALKALNDAVLQQPDSYAAWEALVLEVEQLEGGLNRNSTAEAISLFRAVYDRFLFKFSLFFGFWKKYAQLEFTIGGTEVAEMVYERGLASIPMSTDLWTSYCAFKMETSHNTELIRSIFERGIEAVGLEFHGYTLWEKYIEFEQRNEDAVRVFKILERAIFVPSSAYQRFFVSYQQALQSIALTDAASPETILTLKAEVEAETGNVPMDDYHMDRLVREKLASKARDVYNRTEAETAKRDKFEREIKRPYFHVTELPEEELVNWRRYLSFEEVEGGFRRTVVLYERCLVACALYDEFWLRYARWMLSQPGKEEEVRNIYMRASSIFVPVCRPHVRLQYALFEEMAGRKDTADAIYSGILTSLPQHIDTIVAWSSFLRRHHGPDAGIRLLQSFVDDESNEIYVRGALVAEIARLIWKAKCDPEQARAVFEGNREAYADVRRFWIRYFTFETEQTGVVGIMTKNDPQAISQQIERVRRLIEHIQHKSRVSPATIRDLVHLYQIFLLENSPISIGEEYLQLDKEVNGPFSVQSINKKKISDDGKESTTDARLQAENGHPGVTFEDGYLQRGEDPFAKYYQQQGVPPDPPLAAAFAHPSLPVAPNYGSYA